ncbi:MAG: class I SAM-dependent methyltransferase [Paludisphaera borealis]|uniref:class I SAM-dependent methyltransferase n=1 Tax=Paludisphaera borealis TaxID=1387353 RepID=UPI00283E890C|nr:class I SAM-dependent methyltransferase [Paludisphaera borealis]MDR3618120.1 class I SAM-dependent methyltransferase [Paludisphaera borealis]
MSLVAENKLIETLSPHERMDFAGLQHYFRVGQSALDCVHEGLRAAGKTTIGAAPFGVKTILDLPCGQGRVIRYLRLGFPEAEITACDTSREGVDFCAETFDAVPVYSRDEPEEIPVRRDYYDLVWVGSLFTHLDADMWNRFLTAFRSALKPGGVLIFTTHGRLAYEYMSTKAFHYGHDERGLEELARLYEQAGFGHVHYTGHNSYYGTSISRADWVVDRIRAVDGLRLVQHAEHAWDNHQDAFTCQRDN